MRRKIKAEDVELNDDFIILGDDVYGFYHKNLQETIELLFKSIGELNTRLKKIENKVLVKKGVKNDNKRVYNKNNK